MSNPTSVSMPRRSPLSRQSRRLWRALAAFVAGSALTLVFLSYLQPGLMHTLALQVWNCF